MPSIILIAHNIRSSHNIGSILRTADGTGIDQVILSGYSPYPTMGRDDKRLPHISLKVHNQIKKTALGAEESMNWTHEPDIDNSIARLKKEGYEVYALEQTPNSISLPEFSPGPKIALIAGREVEGVEEEVIKKCDGSIEIPMKGSKESFNVAVASAIALYHVMFIAGR